MRINRCLRSFRNLTNLIQAFFLAFRRRSSFKKIPRGLSEDLRARIVTLGEEGHSTREIARRVAVAQSCVMNTLRRYRGVDNIIDHPRSGRPTVITAAQKHYITLLTARDPTINATKILAGMRVATGLEISTQTIRNCLYQVGFRARRSWRVSLNSQQRQRLRLQWARLRQNEENNEENIWRNCLFVDESRISTHPDNRRLHVWRRCRNAERQRTVTGTVQQGVKSVSFWGCIMIGARTLLIPYRGWITAALYQTIAIDGIVRSFRINRGPRFVLVNDNTPAHRAQRINAALHEYYITRLGWSAGSPDLNPIEHAWDAVKRAVWNRQPPPQTVPEIREVVIQEWDRLPQEMLDNLILSMPRRITACVRARGGVILY